MPYLEEDGACVAFCASNLYAEAETALPAPFQCMGECPVTKTLLQLNTSCNQNRCVARCSTPRAYEQAGVCQRSCTGDYIYVQELAREEEEGEFESYRCLTSPCTYYRQC